MTEEQLQKLERLGALKKDGIITDVEFEQQKKLILGTSPDNPIIPDPIIADPVVSEPIITDRQENVIVSKEESNAGAWKFIGVILVVSVFIAVTFGNKDKKEKPKEPTPTVTEKKEIIAVDSVKLKEELKAGQQANEKLNKYFIVKTDEFSKTTWCTPKAAPKYRNSNGIYCYFEKQGDYVSNFRFVGQYSSEDWLFIEWAQFLIDGVTYDFIPNTVKRDNGSGEIWEWFDESSRGNESLIIALANAKTVKIKYLGSQYYNTRNLSASQIQAIKLAVDTFKGLGG